MSHTTSIRRAAATCGTVGILALTMAAPAGARPDPGEALRHDVGQTRPDGSTLQNPLPGSESSVADRGPAAVTIDDNAIDVLQLGAGVLAGLALAGAGAAMVSRRNHRHVAHPA